MIIKSKYAGFCFGVKRAADLIDSYIGKSEKTIYTLGELIHNDDYNASLRERGVIILNSVEELDELDPEKSIVFIRAHGALKKTYEYLEERGFEYVDATCPFVKNIHDIVIREKEKDDPFYVIIGDSSHPEIQSICSFIGQDNENYLVCSDSKELEKNVEKIPNDNEKRKVVIAQTTQNVNEWKISSKILKKLYTNTTFFDTICLVTQNRQEDAVKISKDVDLMVVVGGQKSSNTKKLYELSRENCESVMISRAEELVPEKFHGKTKIGITAGASTPDGIIQEVINKMTEITKNENNTENEVLLSDEMSFEEMLEKSFRTLNTGDKVTGVITSVTPTEIDLDLGIKHTAILKYDDVTDDPSVDLMREFKVGDELCVLLMKFNDAEGTVQVSKKRVDSFANWEKVEAAFNAQEIVEGKVVETVKAGVIVFWNSVRVFIPASQTNVPKDGDLTALNGTTVRFKFIEADSQKRRAVGSIRVVVREERRAQAEKFWSEIEEGKTYTGKVKSMTNYGVFVDLGGVDGMVHITELSWLRLKHPSEVVSIGDELTVFVKAFDAEKNRISLGYKTAETNPWKLFTDTYKVDDVAKAKIVNMMPFGAFAEILPGVDGLIHISQISNKKIVKPADVLELGQEVDVKIIDVDNEAQKISLSMRALIEEEDVADEVVEETAEEAAEITEE